VLFGYGYDTSKKHTLCGCIQSSEKVKAIKKSKLILQYIYSYILLYGNKTGILGRKNKAGCYLQGWNV